MTLRRIFGRAFVRGEIQDDTLITIDDGQIAEVVQTVNVPRDTLCADGLIAPGFIDLHIHGGDGADFMDGDADGNLRVTRFHAAHGTTALAATTLSASPADLKRAVQQMARSATAATPGSAEIVGINLEGPFINPKRAGAQDRASIRPPDIDELQALRHEAPHLRWMVTVAPELDGARLLMERFRNEVVFAIGHTDADYGQTVEGLAWGATHFTHLFNAMTGLGHRTPGAVGAAMISADATAEIIADGVHVHPAVIRIAVTAIPNRIVLVTDAMRACGLSDGSYTLYGQTVTVTSGEARLGDGTLAGSVLTMHGAVRNMVELAGLPIEVVLPFATEVPARVIGVQDRKAKIAAGYDADLVVLDDKLALHAVIARGNEVVR